MSERELDKVQVAIVGAGPAGIGAAIGLKKQGVSSVLVLERHAQIGGIPGLYKKKSEAVPTFAIWTKGRILTGEAYVQMLRNRLEDFDIDIKTNCFVHKIDAKTRQLTFTDPVDGRRDVAAEAVIFACGAREKTLTERGGVTGARPERMYFTKHLLDLIDSNDCLPFKKPVIIGSDLIAYAAAAKLKSAGSSESIMTDKHRRPQCSWPARIYFNKWSAPIYHGGIEAMQVQGSRIPAEVRLSDGGMIPCDGIVVSGELIPNSELALLGDLQVALPSRIPVLFNKYQLSEPGWFAAGNILGGFHGAEWCYFNGRKVANSVLKYLSK